MPQQNLADFGCPARNFAASCCRSTRCSERCRHSPLHASRTDTEVVALSSNWPRSSASACCDSCCHVDSCTPSSQTAGVAYCIRPWRIGCQGRYANQAEGLPLLLDCHPHRMRDERSAHVIHRCPADNLFVKQVLDGCNIKPALSGVSIGGDVIHPHLVGGSCFVESLFKQIER